MNIFQSHLGSIAAREAAMTWIREARFQSHLGSIAATCGYYILWQPQRAFNPTLVRLRQHVPARPSYFIATFNPTLVRLRRSCGFWAIADENAFNPTLVRLRHC